MTTGKDRQKQRFLEFRNPEPEHPGVLVTFGKPISGCGIHGLFKNSNKSLALTAANIRATPK